MDGKALNQKKVQEGAFPSNRLYLKCSPDASLDVQFLAMLAISVASAVLTTFCFQNNIESEHLNIDLI